jgi:ABC-type transport system involved in cytochrome bd biosynthesis fused ATPase/permease subunit
MSVKSYSFLWIIFFVVASVMWLTGVLSMMAIVVFGFIAFGLVFMGMMCVLPLMVAHPTRQPEEKIKESRQPMSARSAKVVSGYSAYRSA